MTMTLDELELHVRAALLGCVIIEGNPDGLEPDDCDYGPWWLCDAESAHAIWGSGLSLDLIGEALDCLAKEHAGETLDAAWRDFGSRSLSHA
jgi:hypothetical protein